MSLGRDLEKPAWRRPGAGWHHIQFLDGPLKGQNVPWWGDATPERLFMRAPENMENVTYARAVEVVSKTGMRMTRFVADVDMGPERLYVYERQGNVYRLVGAS